MDITISLNVDPSSPEGVRLTYLSNCINQINNLYSIVDSTLYKESLNTCIAEMANFILNNDTPGALTEYDNDITDIQTKKQNFFNDYGNWFFNQCPLPT